MSNNRWLQTKSDPQQFADSYRCRIIEPAISLL